ncbi:MAG: hypothetical protein MUC69_09860, partial [Gemmatimonadales bacterium]|nr:hypothetical protein [Gemmatimonadales bacterium]
MPLLRPAHRALVIGCFTLLSLALAGCGDGDDGGGGGDADLVRATDALFPDDATGTQAETLAGELVGAAASGDDLTAEERAFALVELTLVEFRAGRLDASGGPLPARLAPYVRDVFDEAGLPIPPVEAATFGEEGIIAVVRPAGGTFVSESRRAGLDVPAGALVRAVLLAATRLPDSSVHDPGDGPLPTTLAQYPLFYEFTLTPEVTLAIDAIIGLCQVTESASEYFAPDPIFNRLRLAHPDPDDRSTIALLDRVDAPFLECDGVTANARRASLLARRAGIGGRVRKFSPFGAVEPVPVLGPGLVDPVPYRSFADSPFNGLGLPSFFLEDWEDGLVNTPGVTASSTSLGSAFGGSLIDSVDGDDGVVDGTCAKAELCESGFAGGSISFTFNPAAIDGYPTHVGVVWTDGGSGSDVTFEAFDGNDQLVGTRTVTGLGDGSNSGTVEDVRFFGVVAPGGVGRIVVRNSCGGIEVDHLQY